MIKVSKSMAHAEVNLGVSVAEFGDDAQNTHEAKLR